MLSDLSNPTSAPEKITGRTPGQFKLIRHILESTGCCQSASRTDSSCGEPVDLGSLPRPIDHAKRVKEHGQIVAGRLPVTAGWQPRIAQNHRARASSFTASRRGLRTSSPPQFGQTWFKTQLHLAQNVHSKVQMYASSAGESFAAHFSHSVFIFSAMRECR